MRQYIYIFSLFYIIMSFPPQIQTPEDRMIYSQTQDVIDSLKKIGVRNSRQIKDDEDLERRLENVKKKLVKRGTLPIEPSLSPEIKLDLALMDVEKRNGGKRKTRKTRKNRKNRKKPKRFRNKSRKGKK